jgi:hypothetical protein
MTAANEKMSWKKRITRELVRYSINATYLAIVFGLFAWYRRLILAEYDIRYLKYGVALIEALVLAKVIWMGDLLGLGGRFFKDKPLIYATLYNSAVFSLFVGVFAVLEHTIGGLLKGEGWLGGLAELRAEGGYELIARCLITFCVFIPFFAFKELGKTFGEEGKLGRLFFRKRMIAASG